MCRNRGSERHTERAYGSPPCQGGVKRGSFVEAEEPPPTPPWQGGEYLFTASERDVCNQRYVHAAPKSFTKTLVVLLVLVSALSQQLLADGPSGSQEATGFPNLKFPTRGGKQLWADQLLFHDWRIQKNVITGHFRLLDERNVRHAWGNFAHCKAQLEKIKREKALPPMRGQAVVVLHGLVGTRKTMGKLCDFLRENTDFQVFNIAYPSTRFDIATHAKSLSRIIENLEGVEEIHFVAHSLGNLVIRHYFADQKKLRDARANRRFGRVIMIAPPNHGADFAKRFEDNGIFKLVWGESGQQLAHWDRIRPHLATPPGEFGIIAGGLKDGRGFNPLMDGDDDFILRVAETQLAGASDFVVIPESHFGMPSACSPMTGAHFRG